MERNGVHVTAEPSRDKKPLLRTAGYRMQARDRLARAEIADFHGFSTGFVFRRIGDDDIAVFQFISAQTGSGKQRWNFLNRKIKNLPIFDKHIAIVNVRDTIH